MRNAIDGPGAVMVHLRNASLAYFAVMCSGWLVGLTLTAPSLSGRDCVYRAVCRLPVLWHVARVGQDGTGVTYQKNHDEAVECDGFLPCQGLRFDLGEQPLRGEG